MAEVLKKLFTIGHSSLEPGRFVGLLKRCQVDAVGDVRSLPQSSRFPQFSQAVLEKLLEEQSISSRGCVNAGSLPR